MRRLVWLMVLASGCALGPGEPMGTLEPSLTVRYAAEPGRDAGDGFHRLASDFQVRVTRAELSLCTVELVERSVSGGGGFDPAHPPPGYGLCHNGHCHADDGRLVSYEDIAAELGGGVQSRTVVALHGPEAMNLLADAGDNALTCAPDCVLSAAHVERIHVPVSQLHIEGAVRDGRESLRFTGTRPFSFDLTVPAGGVAPVLTAEVDVSVDRETAPVIHLALALELGPALFDRVDWAALAVQPDAIVLSSTQGTDAYAEVRTSLTERASLDASIERSFP